MPLLPRVPKYRHYRPKDLGVVRLDGHDIYLGPYGSESSIERYNRLIAEWLNARAEGKTSASPPLMAIEAGPNSGGGISVNEVLLAYMNFATAYYSKDGQPTEELECMREALIHAKPSRVSLPGSHQVPSYVYLPNRLGHLQGYDRLGQYAGWLGRAFNPLATDIQKCTKGDNPYFRALARNEELDFRIKGLADSSALTLDRLSRRQSLLDQFELARRELDRSSQVAAYDSFRQAALALVTTAQPAAADTGCRLAQAKGPGREVAASGRS